MKKSQKPKPGFIYISTRIPTALNDSLNAICERTGLKKQAVIARGIQQVVEQST